MKKTWMVLCSCALLMRCSAQNNSNGALINFTTYSSQLTDKSDTLRRKYYYKYEIDLRKDEMVLIKYISPEFGVALWARNQKGDTLGSVDVPKYFTGKGSHLSYLFKAGADGRYQFLLTSKDSLDKGKYTLYLATFNPVGKPFDDNWDLCQKLDYLLQQSATDFEFIAGKSKGFSLTNTRTTDLYLLSPSTCEIEYFDNNTYVCTMLENMNLEKCTQRMREMDYDLKQCLTPEWKIGEVHRQDVSELNQERFQKEIDYKLPGKPADDHNLVHEKYNLKYYIRFSIEKNMGSGYDLKIIIE